MKLIKKGIVLVIILYGVFFLLDVLFTEVFKNGYYNKTQWINKYHDESFDYIVHGSSRAYTTLDVGRLNKELSLKGINLSVDGSWINEQSLMLEMFLAKGNKTKKIFLQVDPWALNLEGLSEFAIPKFFPYLKDDIVFNHYKEFGAKWYAYRYIPFYRYAEFNSIWGPHEVLVDAFHLVHPDYDANGGHFYTETEYRGSKKLEDKGFAEYKAKFKYFNRIVELCKKNNIELICFTAPISNVEVNDKYTKSMEVFTQILAQKGVKYYNFGAIYSTQFDKFVDEVHLNAKGVAAFHNEVKKMISESENKAVLK